MAKQPQKAKAEASEALSGSFLPRAREIAQAPPTPNKLAIADRNINEGIHTVTAVSISSLPVMPMKKVSAMLYMTIIICPNTVGNAKMKIDRNIGIFSNKSCFEKLIGAFPPHRYAQKV